MNRRVGINAHMASAFTMDLVPPTGCGSVRLDAPWPDLEPSKGQWNFEALDESVYAARARDLEVLMTISGTPSWAGASRNAPPYETVDWTNAVRTICERYRHNVWFFGVWNEPNRENFWSGSVSGYIYDLFLPAAQVIHEVGPENRVCGPEITLMDDWPSWLTIFLRLSGWRPVDIITLHCYADNGREVMRTLGTSPRSWWPPWKLPSAREVIQRAAYGEMEVWLTETGWNTEEYLPMEQADNYDQLFEVLPNTPWLERVYGYDLIDEEHSNYGIYEINRQPKPSVGVFQRRAGL